MPAPHKSIAVKELTKALTPAEIQQLVQGSKMAHLPMDVNQASQKIPLTPSK